MKQAYDAILRPEQAAYLDALNGAGLRALAALAGVAPVDGRDPLLAKMEARAAAKHYPISDPEVAAFLSVVARIARPKLVVELGTNIGYGAIVLARAAGPEARVVTIEYSAEIAAEARGFIAEAGLADRVEVRLGTALEGLGKIAGPIDLLYVDCVKEEYPRYLERRAQAGREGRRRGGQRALGRSGGEGGSRRERGEAGGGAPGVQPGAGGAPGPLRRRAPPGDGVGFAVKI